VNRVFDFEQFFSKLIIIRKKTNSVDFRLCIFNISSFHLKSK